MAKSSRAEKVAWITAVALEEDYGEGCRLWPWAKTPKGYGQVWWFGRLRQVGHVMLDLTTRPRPPGSQQLHSCDTPECAAPWHLRWGTNAENRAESVARGRTSRGVGRPLAKLDEDAVRHIRSSREPLAALAARYGVTMGTISKARAGVTWSHVGHEVVGDPGEIGVVLEDGEVRA